MKILVLLGGSSNEREVSLRSGRSVVNALKTLGHDVVEYDPAVGYGGLREYVGKVDVVLPILHGHGGEDGEVQKQLDILGFKYLGSGEKVSRLCFDKVYFKKSAVTLGVNMPPSELVSKETIKQSKFLKEPYVLKPIRGGSSLDTFVVKQPGSLPDLKVFDHYNKMLIEKLIEGDEITVPVLGDKALPVIEIIPPEGGEFDYKNKYNGVTEELCPPKSISEYKQHEAQSIAELIHQELGVRHLSRTDMILDDQGKLWVLEINNMPGLTSQSLFPKSATVAEISFEQLVERFVSMASSA